jgi:hypothetical protein
MVMPGVPKIVCLWIQFTTKACLRHKAMQVLFSIFTFAAGQNRNKCPHKPLYADKACPTAPAAFLPAAKHESLFRQPFSRRQSTKVCSGSLSPSGKG